MSRPTTFARPQHSHIPQTVLERKESKKKLFTCSDEKLIFHVLAQKQDQFTNQKVITI